MQKYAPGLGLIANDDEWCAVCKMALVKTK